jgi:hypothetical protein
MAVSPEICTVFARGGLFRSSLVRKLDLDPESDRSFVGVAIRGLVLWGTAPGLMQIFCNEPSSGAATLRCNPFELKNPDHVLELACFRLFIPIPAMMLS